MKPNEPLSRNTIIPGSTSSQPADRLAASAASRKRREEYAAFASSTVPKDFSLSGVKVAVDVANGAAFQTTPMVLAMLGAQVELHSGAPDGFNINLDCGSTHPALSLAMFRNRAQRSVLPTTAMPIGYYSVTITDLRWMATTCWRSLQSTYCREINCKKARSSQRS